MNKIYCVFVHKAQYLFHNASRNCINNNYVYNYIENYILFN